MFKEDLRALILERENTFYNDDDRIYLCRRKMTDFICSHIEEAVDFVLHDCTGDEYVCLSEIFLEITEGSRSHAFIRAIRSLLDKYPVESKKYNIEDFVEEAEGVLAYLDWEEGKEDENNLA